MAHQSNLIRGHIILVLILQGKIVFNLTFFLEGCDIELLRFEVSLISPLPTDKYRKFILTYFLEDDTISIYENVLENSGLRGGKFLERRKLDIPNSRTVDNTGPETYKLKDLTIGSTIQVYGRNFVVRGADRAVLNYIDQNEIYICPDFRSSLINYFNTNVEEKIPASELKVPVA